MAGNAGVDLMVPEPSSAPNVVWITYLDVPADDLVPAWSGTVTEL